MILKSKHETYIINKKHQKKIRKNKKLKKHTKVYAKRAKLVTLMVTGGFRGNTFHSVWIPEIIEKTEERRASAPKPAFFGVEIEDILF